MAAMFLISGSLLVIAAPASADNEDAPKTNVCHWVDDDPFDYWTVKAVEDTAIEWWLDNFPGDFVIGEQQCPVPDSVVVCVQNATGWDDIVVDPATGNWYVEFRGAVLPTDEGCPTSVPDPDPTPEPTPEPTPDPTPEPTPDPTPEPTPDPTPEVIPDPTPTEEPEDNTESSAPDPGDDDDDAEVLGKTVTRETLAFTGAESSELALYGAVLLMVGLLMLGGSRSRRFIS